ncbi:DNA replication licensing factor [Loa loa]|uniref:DNA replication licensing factor MCM3 n=1 Tax=Loa loa TaxID=7209 RepID=A0A1I7VA38_LOALO|nr:DNA replication licensing factor [Loa loa]EFO21958.1 DNA replication licensing factor [Loa loa]
MDLISREDENRAREITLEYLNFLDDSGGDKVYLQKCEDMIKDNGSRIIINLNELRKKLPQRVTGLLRNFVPEILCLQQAMKDYVSRLDPEYGKTRDFNVGFEGSFGDRHVNPRTLKSHFLGSMVCCEGIVTKCSALRPKVVRSVHYCPATKKTFERRYTDLTSYDAFPCSNVYPTELGDENKNPLETEYGLSTYRDHQTFSIQEMPEYAPPGQLPRSIDVVADDDLADNCKPGDRVRVIGLYRCLPNKQNGYTSGSFRSIIISNNIQLLSKEMQPNFLPDDIKNIRKMSRQKNIFDTLARSLAPSIWGHDEVKKAILCLLLGGNEKILQNGSHIRGDINILLIGDPSVAKSQLLRYVLHTAPRAIATTGRGSSGVGLTAAVTTDIDSGERRLEAGAMVLADRGIVCIDEFDKMSDIDRTAIHEVMEQGRVTIAKAGIHAKLNARCSVLAAANPVFGRYDLFKTPMENIGMQDSLLSRFDVIFVLMDEHDPNHDNNVAEHILKLHQYRTPGEPDGAVLPMGADIETLTTFDMEEVSTTSEICEKNKEWCAGKASDKLFTMHFLRKYIHMAKSVKPKLTEEACAYISECYAELRSYDTSKTDRERTMPVTVRQLETMIRISTAMAKARLAKNVERLDAEKAYQLLHYACFKEKPKERLEMEEKRRRKHGGNEESGDDETEDEDIEDLENLTSAERTATETSLRHSKRYGGDTQISGLADSEATTAQLGESSMDKTMNATDLSGPSPKRLRRETPSISIDRYKTFRKYLRKAFDDCGNPDDMIELSIIRNAIQEQAGRLSFNDAEFEAAFERLTAENIAMIADNRITLI